MCDDFPLILLVEDNDDHAELIRSGLVESQIAGRVVHVEDGAEALDYLLRRGTYSDPSASPRPRVVVLDLRLPKVDGLEVLKQVKQTAGLECVPVVILTTSSADRDVAMAYECHANSYLTKPMDFGRFREMMGQLGDYWLSYNQLPRRAGEQSARHGSSA